MYYNDNNLIYYGLPILGFLITFIAQIYIKITYSKYKGINANSRKTGADVAREILDKHNLQKIRLEEVSGELTDHYDPTNSVIRLSQDIYNGISIAAVSVAAHECGHAIQDKENYTPMRIRAKLVPVVNFSTKIGYLIVVIGLILGALNLATIGIILLLSMLLFQLVTLPVEFDASRRGKKELKDLLVLNTDEQTGSRKVLKAAAFTYVASVFSTLLQILRLALMVASRRSRK